MCCRVDAALHLPLQIVDSRELDGGEEENARSERQPMKRVFFPRGFVGPKLEGKCAEEGMNGGREEGQKKGQIRSQLRKKAGKRRLGDRT